MAKVIWESDEYSEDYTYAGMAEDIERDNIGGDPIGASKVFTGYGPHVIVGYVIVIQNGKAEHMVYGNDVGFFKKQRFYDTGRNLIFTFEFDEDETESFELKWLSRL